MDPQIFEKKMHREGLKFRDYLWIHQQNQPSSRRGIYLYTPTTRLIPKIWGWKSPQNQALMAEEEEVLIEVEAAESVYGDDCVVLEQYPPHLHLLIKPRTADVSSQQVSIKISQFPFFTCWYTPSIIRKGANLCRIY